MSYKGGGIIHFSGVRYEYVVRMITSFYPTPSLSSNLFLLASSKVKSRLPFLNLSLFGSGITIRQIRSHEFLLSVMPTHLPSMLRKHIIQPAHLMPDIAQLASIRPASLNNDMKEASCHFNAFASQSQLQHPMSVIAKAGVEWPLQSWPTQRRCPCRIGAQPCLPS